MKNTSRKTIIKSLALSCSMFVLLAACEQQQVAEPVKPTVAEATAFIEDAGLQLQKAGEHLGQLSWVNANFITTDTNALVAVADEDYIRLSVSLAEQAKKYQSLQLPADVARRFEMLKQANVLPAPNDAAKTTRLAVIKSDLGATYSTGKVDMEGEQKTLGDVSDIIGSDRTPERLYEAWDGWRKIAKPMKDDFAEMVAIANEGARELGYKDVGTMWRSGYDMDPDAFADTADKLWGQVKPLYDALHCHVRSKLSDHYGDRIVGDDGAIPAHLLGNMWAQSWSNIYPLVKPEGGASGVDITAALEKNGYDAIKMVKTGESFFSSLGFDPLPDTFWERSLFVKPKDREVACHASAWDLDNKDDIRIKMCTKVNEEDFSTVHHELGHNYYQRAYKNQGPFHITGAHDGFHEAIGDMVALSITPDYLKTIGLIDEVPSADADIALLMQRALEKVAFLPFGLMVDKWRWQVFSGELTPDTYNSGWWKLREEYQGIKPGAERPADAFDPGAKYHIPANTPYMRYFLAHILQFQFHEKACEMAGWEGPLHRCSIYGNKEVGTRLNAMMEMGASKPWPDALEAFIGTRDMDGSAVVAYFEPLKVWLDEQNKDRTCGW